MSDDKRLLNRKEASAYLEKLGIKLSPGTLANMASNNNAGKGPAFLRLRWSTVRYRKEDLEVWVNRHSQRVE